MSQVGKPREKVTIAPVEEPVPSKEPVSVPTPTEAPVKEPVA